MYNLCIMYLLKIWCLLTILLEVDFTGGEKIVNYDQMKKLLKNSKSILINGKKIELEEWLSQGFDDVDDNTNSDNNDNTNSNNNDNINSNDDNNTKSNDKENKNSKIMYTFIKCECAFEINSSLDSIYNSIKKFSNDEDLNTADAQKCLDENSAIPFLEQLNIEIKLAITTFFEIIDSYPNLKSAESYFLKTLIMTSFYIDGLTYVKSKTEDPSITKEYLVNWKTDKLELVSVFVNLTSEDKYMSPIYLEELRHKHHNIELPKMLYNMRRVLLQIMNLIDRYTLEYCYSNVDNYVKKFIITEDNGKSMFEQNLSRLNYFLKTIVPLRTNSPLYTMFDIENLMLKNCMRNKYDQDFYLKSFCEVYLKEGLINAENDKFMFMSNLFNLVEYSFDIESIYEYLLAVYKIILKSIYKETEDVFRTGQLLAIEECEPIISELKSKDFPIEIIDLFEYLLNAKTFKDTNELNESAIKKCYKDLSKVESHDLSNVCHYFDHPRIELIPMTELMNIIFGVEFKQFWWVFNLLYNESEKKSHRAYDVTLNLFPENAISSSETTNEFKCKRLNKFYENFSFLEFKNNECLPGANEINLNDTINCFLEIRNRNLSFANFLFHDVKKWDKVDYLKTDNDLESIFLNAIIYLQNESNYFIDTTKYQDQSKMIDLRELISRKLEKLKRIGYVIMNLLDNYQIRNCKNPKLRSFLNQEYINNTYNKIQFVNISRVNSRSVLINVRDIVTIDKSIKSEKCYDFSQLTGKNEIDQFESFGNGIFFNWHGEVKSMQEIQIDISKNMLDIHDLVQYQRLYLKWIMYIFYYSWYVIFDRINADTQSLKFEDRKFYVLQAVNVLNVFHKKLIHPKPFEKYAASGARKFMFYNRIILKEGGSGRYLELIEKLVIRSMAQLLGIIKEKKIEIDEIEKILKIDLGNSNDVPTMFRMYGSIVSFVEHNLKMIDEKFIFFKQSLQTFNFTYPQY